MGIRDILGRGAPGVGQAQDSGTKLTYETIEQAREDGRYVVQGRVLSVAGQKIFKVGERAPVAWKNGEPVFILGHSWRRAQFHEVGPEIGVGDIQVVSATTVDDDQPGVIFSSAALGKFAVNVEKAPLSVPAGFSNVEAKWCQDDPSVVMWIGADGDSDPPRIAALTFKIKGRTVDSATGSFGRTGKRVNAGTFGNVPEVSTELIDLVFWEENEVILRRVRARPKFVETLVFNRFDRVQDDQDGDIAVSIDFSYGFSSRENPPLKILDALGNIIGDATELVEDIEYSVTFNDMKTLEYYCVNRGSGLEVLALINSEEALDNKEFLPSFPPRIGIVVTKMRFERSGSGSSFEVTGTPDGAFDPLFPPASFPGGGSPNLVSLLKVNYVSVDPPILFKTPPREWFLGIVPLYVLSVTNKNVVARTIKEDVLVEWRVHVGTTAGTEMVTGSQLGTFRFKTGFGLNNFLAGVPVPGAATNLEPQAIPSTAEPAAIQSGNFFGDKPVPNPFLSTPWIAEFDSIPITESFSALIAQSFRVRVTRFFPGSPFSVETTASGGGISWGGGSSNFTSLTQSIPSLPARQGYLSGLNVFVRATPQGPASTLNPSTRDTPFIGEWIPVENKLVEIPGLGEDRFPFQANVRFGLASLGAPATALYDREDKKFLNVTPESVDRFAKGTSLINDLVMSPARLFQFSADKVVDRVLIKVALNDEGAADFTRTKDIVVKRQAWPDFALGSDATAVIFPRKVELKGNP